MKKYCLVWKCKGASTTILVDFILAKDEEDARLVADKFIKSHLTLRIYKHYEYDIEHIIEITDDIFHSIEKIEKFEEGTKKFIEDFINSKENEDGENS